ncbi:MAG: dihydrodipicolinate synthase family protein [Chloroflexi bacterium]|nr:dihydrodipicolinate synthase family protein [Chloroflexota bacterium]
MEADAPGATVWRGIFAVTVTPFSEEGDDLDEPGLSDLLGTLLDDGVDRLVVNGNTGEYHTLSAEERRRVVEIAGREARERAALLIVGAAGPWRDVLWAAEHAAANGADAVMIHHPVHPYVSPDGLIEYLGRVGLRSPISIVPYLKVALGEDEAKRLADVPMVRAVKWGVNDLPAFGRAVAATRDRADEIAWICGTAELWAPFFHAVGAVGYTSGLVNVAAGPSFELFEALEAGDRERAMAAWDRVAPFERLRARSNDAWNVAVVKEAMRQVGRAAGPVRPPSTDVPAGDHSLIAHALGRWPVRAAR